MKLFLPCKRATLLVPSGTARNPNLKHLHILLTDAYGEAQENLIVGVTTVYPKVPHDDACYLYPGDHDFIKHQSYVLYSEAQIVAASKLTKAIHEGIFDSKGTLSEEAFARVCYGVEKSQLITPKMLRFYLAAVGQI